MIAPDVCLLQVVEEGVDLRLSTHETYTLTATARRREAEGTCGEVTSREATDKCLRQHRASILLWLYSTPDD